ncbi:MAG: hypothetical protein ACPKPY_12725 [Nitrososphaeraceae archaeon]
MNKIRNTRLSFIFSFLVVIKIILVTTTTLSSHTAYSENNKVNDINIGKFFTSPVLSIQQANSGLISEINSTTYLVRLNDVSDKTVSFADRPDGFVEARNTSDFIGNWSILIGAHTSYAEVPPNAALIVDDKKGLQEIFVIELYNPVYDNDENILKYDFTVVDNSTFDKLPLDIGHSALIIDGF